MAPSPTDIATWPNARAASPQAKTPETMEHAFAPALRQTFGCRQLIDDAGREDQAHRVQGHRRRRDEEVSEVVGPSFSAMCNSTCGTPESLPSRFMKPY